MSRKRAEDYAEKQQFIIDTAASVVANLGLEKASMSEIAREGNISKALLYHYYKSKEALIFDIVLSHLTKINAALDDIGNPDAPPEERLRLLIHEVVDLYENADDKHKVQLAIMSYLPEDQAEQIKVVERKIVSKFSDVLKEINPHLNDDQRLLKPMTMSIFGILNWIYMWFRPNGDLTRGEYADKVTTMILKGLKEVR
jgi:AcrR family transcriptional regulator